MGFLLGIVIGLIGGAIAVYLWQQKIVTKQAEAIQQMRRQLDQLEQDHEQRLRQATEQLRQDYDAQIAALSTPPDPVPVISPASASAVPAPEPTPETTPEPVTDQPSQMSRQADGGAIADPAPRPSAPSQPEPTELAPTNPPQPETKLTSLKPKDEVSLSTLAQDSRHPDPALRRQVAVALQSITRHGPAPVIQRSLPLLKQLSQDSDPTVRLEAITAVAEVKSPKALALLRRALRDSDSSVVALASAALTKFKGYQAPVTPTTPPKLPKNR